MAIELIILIVITVFLSIMAANEDIRDFYESVNQGGLIPKESQQGLATIKAAVTTIKVGHFVSRKGETEPEVDIANIGDGSQVEYVASPASLTELLIIDPNWDLDTAFAAATKLFTYKLGCGAIVPVFLAGVAGPVAVEKGDTAVLAANGEVALYAYTDAAVATDTLIERVGTFEESDAGHATERRVLLLRLD